MTSLLTLDAGTSGSGSGAGAASLRSFARTPERAVPGTVRGSLWILVIAADFFLMSNPLVFVAGMDRALTIAVMITGSALVVTLPWVRAPRITWPVLLFLGWLLLSRTWSIQPTFTSAAWAQTAGIAFVALVITANASARVLAAGVVAGGVAVSGASIYAFQAQLPGAYQWPLDGDLLMSGVGTNQNILAYTLTLSLCGAGALLPRSLRGRGLWLISVAVICYTLVESHSATGTLTAILLSGTTVLLIGYGPLSRRLLHTRTHRVAAAVAGAAAFVAAVLLLARLLGQNLFTFSDRTPLWSAAIAVAQERPWGGFGYGAVWQHPWKPPLLNIVIGDIWDRSGTALSHGHNSVVDLVVEVGLVGVLLTVVIMVTVAMRATALLRSSGPGDVDDTTMARFIVLCLVDLTVCGVTEPMAAIPLGWWALVLLTGPVQRTKRGARRRESPAMRPPTSAT